LQRGHGLGGSLSKSSIRVRSSHSPHHAGRRLAGGRGSLAGASRAASTATAFLIPALLAPAKLARPSGVQPSREHRCDQGRKPLALACGQQPSLIPRGELLEELPDLGPAAADARPGGQDLARRRGGGSLMVLWWIG